MSIDFRKIESEVAAALRPKRKNAPAVHTALTAPSRGPASSSRQPFDPSSDQIEALFQATFCAGARVVAVIGVEPGDGASSCAAALAQRSALADRSTLLVDASGAMNPPFAPSENGSDRPGPDSGSKDGPQGATPAAPQAAHFDTVDAAGPDWPAFCCAENGVYTRNPDVEFDDAHFGPDDAAHGDGAWPVELAWTRLDGVGDTALLLREPAYLRSLWAKSYGEWTGVVIDCAGALAATSPYPGRLVAQSADAVILVARGGVATAESIEAAKAALGSSRIVGIAINGRDQPKVSAEVAQRARRFFRYLPSVGRFIANRAERSRLLDVIA